MKLEKTNETIWSIKRKEHSGKFVLRSTEGGGRLIKLSITLINEDANEVCFEMEPSEFKNFFGILSSFKDFVESPNHNFNFESELEEIPMSDDSVDDELDSDGLDMEAIAETMKAINLKTANMINSNANDLNIPKIPFNKLKEKSQEIIQNSQNSMISETKKNKKQLLKETDWDPW